MGHLHQYRINCAEREVAHDEVDQCYYMTGHFQILCRRIVASRLFEQHKRTSLFNIGTVDKRIPTTLIKN